MFLGELRQSPKGLPGIGPKALADLAKLGITTVSDLFWHLPREFEDHSREIGLKEAIRDSIPANCGITVVAHNHFPFKGKQTLKIQFEDPEGIPGVLICFNRPFLAQSFPVNSQAWIYGEFRYRFGEIQSGAFQLVKSEGNPPKDFGKILPVYPLSGSLSQAQIRRAVSAAFQSYWKGIREEVPTTWLEEEGLMKSALAFRELHFPTSKETWEKARRSLAYQELVHLQFTLLGQRTRSSIIPAHRNLPRDLLEKVRGSLPFSLTEDQNIVLDEILEDLARPRPMARLLQGDVGSGKTLVALMSAAAVIQQGAQVALMAPTELLARQHAQSASKILGPLGIHVAYLTGNIQSRQRAHLMDALTRGEIHLVVGTHALFSKDAMYKSLRYVIVDEQHRFGVSQRAQLSSKGQDPDLLMMSATPIPRSLALTAFGDLDVSTIRTMPAGRIPIKTHLALQSNIKKVYDYVRKEVDAGNQVYWVYPLIEQTGKSELQDAVSSYSHLSQNVFPGVPCGLLHSKIPDEEKQNTMAQFQSGALRILVATSVVEVGVDVPGATCMVIEHAERFGLSALHQLRGRVGRAELQSYCFLVYQESLSEEAKSRLLTMKESTDGFAIAQADLEIRGPGELLGVRQSGFLRLRAANLVKDTNLLVQARAKVLSMVESAGEERLLFLELFEKAPPFRKDLTAGA